MSLNFRPGTPNDAQVCGQIAYDAFSAVNQKHGFQPDFPSPDVAIGFLESLLQRSDFYSVVAEQNGRIVGSNFLNESNPVAGVGPVTVAPDVQDQGIGGKLMENVLARAGSQNCESIRLVQASFHMRSLSLYTKLGFAVRDTMVIMSGNPLRESIPGYRVRQASENDIEVCHDLHFKLQQHDRRQTLRDGIARGTAVVVERDDRLTGFATSVTGLGHAAGETSKDLIAIISEADELPGMLIPTRNHELFDWCLNNGLRIGLPQTLMTMGPYAEPKGAYMPSMYY